MIRVLVTGDRNWDNRLGLFTVLDSLLSSGHEIVIIEGGASGADALAREWAIFREQTFIEVRAKWSTIGRGAGPERNERMAIVWKPDRVAAFHDNIEVSKGTKSMIAIAERLGIPVKLFTSELISNMLRERSGQTAIRTNEA